MDKAISVDRITKRYQLYNNTKERLFDLVSPKKYGQEFYALQDVSFKVKKGDIVGFVGINGSGKSTLANIIAGIVPETTGSVRVNGETSLIAVAAGLKEDLTGRDNIELKCLMLGFTKKEIKKLEPSVIEFSELGHFINQPVKSYSSGMKSRLGFAISVSVDPEILIIDEALSVGDKAFAEKSFNKMMEFKDMGKTIIFVSHSIEQMKKFCEKILWLEFGRVKSFGTVKEVIPKYEKFLGKWKEMSKEKKDSYKKYALLQDENELKRLMDKEMKECNQDKNNIERKKPISRIGHIREGESYIYHTLKKKEERISSETYKHSSYYIKKEALFNDELYLLLSHQPSAINGRVGWMKADEVSSHLHILIDHDSKKFIIKGTGSGYNRPWGGKKNIVIAVLDNYHCSEFGVECTEKVGGTIWYFGALCDDKYVWIQDEHLAEK